MIPERRIVLKTTVRLKASFQSFSSKLISLIGISIVPRTLFYSYISSSLSDTEIADFSETETPRSFAQQEREGSEAFSNVLRNDARSTLCLSFLT